MSLSLKLVLLCAVAVLPAAGIQLWSELALREQRRAEVHAEAQRVAAYAASELDSLLAGTRQLLTAIAAAPSVAARDAGSCSAYIAEMERALPEYARISVADRDGRLLCAAVDLPADFSVAGQPYFQEALRTRAFTLGEFQVGRLSGRPLLSLAQPILGPGGEVDRVGIAALDLARLSTRLEGRGLPPGGSVTVADRSGVIVARAPFPERFVGSRIPDQFLDLLSAPAPGTQEVRSQDGTRRVIGYVPVDFAPRGLYVSAGLSTEAAFALVDRSARAGLLLIAAGVLSAMLAAFVAARLFLAPPVQRLMRAMERWREGDMAARVGPITGGSELLRLGAGFDSMADALERRTVALRDSEARLRLAQEAGEIGSWDWDIRTGTLFWSESCHRLHGTDPAAPPDLTLWSGNIHPEDRARVEASLRTALEGRGTVWEVEFRFIRPSDGRLRWIAGRGSILRDPGTGEALRVLGIALDTTERHVAEERQTLLMREVDHRAKNALAVVQTMLRLTRADSLPSFIRAVSGRVAALARTQTLLADQRWSGADLHTVLQGELAPFLVDQRVELSGPPVVLAPGTAQPVAMVAHELATNAVKHGALSVADGRILVSWQVAGAPPGVLSLRWAEAGGPRLERPPEGRGFGSRVLEGTVKGQLGGTLRLHWAPTGLVCEIKVPLREAVPEVPPEQSGLAAE